MIPAVGTPAPDFALPDQFGQSVTLSGLRGRCVLLVFFPLAFTPICAGELGAIQSRHAEFFSDAVTTVALSVGPMPSHKVWARAEGFEFPILADFWPHGAVAQAYGVFNARHGYSDRGTFVVDADGLIRFASRLEPGQIRDGDVWDAALACC